MAPKCQHYIARTYLEGWLFNDSQVYFFENKECDIGVPRNPKKCLKEPHVYTVDFDTLLLLRDCSFIKEDFVRKIDKIFKERKIYAKYNDERIDFKSNFLSNNFCLDKWEFHYKDNNNEASKKKIINQIKDLHSYVIECEFSRHIERNWKNTYDNFLLELKNAKITQSGDRIISKDCVNEVMRFVIITMLRNPNTDPFGIYEAAGKLYDLLPYKKFKNQQMKGHFLKQIYTCLFNVDNSAYKIIDDNYNNGKYNISLFKATDHSSFITSDNCSFINNGDFRGMFFPMSARFLLVVGSGKNSMLNEIHCELLKSDKVKRLNQKIYENAINSVVSMVEYLPDILL
ncbi:MAG: DUF4238 domain-containing protein [Anaerolineaceae bacterium]|nr:DUF4238 domain-containing protein [Anaerolineaceae bacterium]